MTMNAQFIIDQVNKLIGALSIGFADTLASKASAAQDGSFAINRDMLDYSSVSVQIILSGNDANDATIQLQDSLDGSNWNNVGNPVTLNVSVGMIRLTNFSSRYIRAVYTHGANTLGTFNILISAKR